MTSCKKCGASSGNLVEVFERTPYGSVKSISCRVCGNLTCEVPTAVPVTKGGPNTKRCSGCGKNKVKSRKSKKGLCVPCRTRLQAWIQSDQKKPAPFIKVLGVWIKNKKQPLT